MHIMTAVSECGEVLQHTSDELKNSVNVVKAVISNHDYALHTSQHRCEKKTRPL